MYTESALSVGKYDKIQQMKEIKKNLGDRIREAREEAGMTQKELGKVLEYSPMGISHFENGIRELKISDVKKLSEFFKKDMSYFLQSETTLFRASEPMNENISDALKNFDAFLDSIDNS